ncbi:hypothetical protein WOC76_04190 [Methylocystis sp. IM3]|uniref:hypothetical protein n=1 Tax=unclassified Methylocystis TaxID=2625913 RepID=UPI000FAA948B|nr:MAG: hypothetical protein EKK29_22305 [Hyphomicrobiales bacterium]
MTNLFPAILACALVAPTVSNAAAACAPAEPPASWSSEKEAAPASPPNDPKSVNPLTLVIFRHAEKPLGDDGVMVEDGNLGHDAEKRLSGLPDSLLSQFGCPDMLVTTNPSGKMLNKKTGRYFNYVRPLATIAPVSRRIDFPVWTPYGYKESEYLARDLLSDHAFLPDESGRPKTIFISWERNAVGKLFDYLKDLGGLRSLSGGTLTVDGVQTRCEEPKKWAQCDFDSIWLVRIKDGAICLTVKSEGLNSESFQRRCKGAESTTDSQKQ